MSLTIMTWLWLQTPDRFGYFKDGGGADKVNVWAAMLRRHCSLDIELACVTDEPDGIDPSIRIIPMPVFDATRGILVKSWSEKGGAPQCYRRLTMFHPDAWRIFGARRFVSMDLDCIVTRDVAPLFDHDCPFVMFKGTSSKRPYNGSMVQMDAGARSIVWERFAADPQGIAEKARRKFIGSDQAVISDVLGWGEERWGRNDGVESYGGAFIRRNGGNPRRIALDESVRLMFFPGHVKPWHLLDKTPFVAQHWHDGIPRGTFTTAQRRQKPPAKQPPFYAFDDRQKIGRRFKAAADRITGRPTRLFIRDYRVPAGARVFVCAPSELEQRDLVERLQQRGALVLPTSQVKRLNFDDPGSFTLAVEQLKGLTASRDEDQAQQAIAG